MMARTESEVRDRKMLNQARTFARQESINNIPFMNARQKENIKERIFKNDDITRANARMASRKAGREQDRAVYQLERA